MFFQAKQSGCSAGSKSGGGSTESEGPVHVSVNRHDIMLLCTCCNCVTFVHFQGGEDLDEEIAQILVNAPYIVVMEASEATTYDVIVERSSLFWPGTMR